MDCPNFEFLNNTHVNQKLDDLYQKFDLLDCIRLRHPNYLKSDIEKPIYLELPILKNKCKRRIITFDKMPHEGILDLYHAALKQFEPLPRCVFYTECLNMLQQITTNPCLTQHNISLKMQSNII